MVAHTMIIKLFRYNPKHQNTASAFIINSANSAMIFDSFRSRPFLAKHSKLTMQWIMEYITKNNIKFYTNYPDGTGQDGPWLVVIK